jgi:hypothetical protein
MNNSGVLSDKKKSNKQGNGYRISLRLGSGPKIADRKQDGIPDFTPIFDLIREERILSAILGGAFSWQKFTKSAIIFP